MKLLYFPFIQCWDGEKMGERAAQHMNYSPWLLSPLPAFLYFPLCQIPMYQDTNAPLYPMYFETEQNGLNTELSIEFNN